MESTLFHLKVHRGQDKQQLFHQTFHPRHSAQDQITQASKAPGRNRTDGHAPARAGLSSK